MASVLPAQVEFDPFALPPEPVKRWTVEEYHELIRQGTLTEDDPYELLEGWLVTKLPKGTAHDAIIDQLHELIAQLLPKPWRCRTQSAVTLSDGEPEPDGAIVLGPATRYFNRHPGPADIAVIIEVSDTTLQRDRGIKLRSYARAGIPEYWIVNIKARAVEVYTSLKPKRKPPVYAAPRIYSKKENVPVAIEGKACGAIRVEELFAG
jgi:Uma2 family endonuclease